VIFLFKKVIDRKQEEELRSQKIQEQDNDNTKPFARMGRKAKGLSEIAGLPKSQQRFGDAAFLYLRRRALSGTR